MPLYNPLVSLVFSSINIFYAILIAMPIQNPPSQIMVDQDLPETKQMSFEGLYLDQGLVGLSEKIGRPIVVSDFLADRNGVIAVTDEQGSSRVPPEIKNPYDWRLFQELMVQADVIISSSAYVRGLQALGKNAQNILSQFEKCGKFAQLGEWRLGAGYPTRSPDLAIVSRALDFTLPEKALASGRRISILTTDSMAISEKAAPFTAAGAVVIGCGESGVEGNRMVDWLSSQVGYRVIMMAAGPAVLDLLLKADRLDLLYITEVQREIPPNGYSALRNVLSGGKKVSELPGFALSHRFIQANVSTDDGSVVSQHFLRYDRMGLLSEKS
jgi:riboflavin biosynthesis pyrimidine reductase